MAVAGVRMKTSNVARSPISILLYMYAYINNLSYYTSFFHTHTFESFHSR